MKAVVRTSENTAMVVGPGVGVLACVLWLMWVIYVLTAFLFVLALVVTVVAVLWIVHDVKAYKIRKAIRQARVGEWHSQRS